MNLVSGVPDASPIGEKCLASTTVFSRFAVALDLLQHQLSLLLVLKTYSSMIAAEVDGQSTTYQGCYGLNK